MTKTGTAKKAVRATRTKPDARHRSLAEALASTREAYDREHAIWQKDRAEMETYAAALSRKALDTESYAKSLTKDRHRLQGEFVKLQGYAKSVASELATLYAAADAERAAWATNRAAIEAYAKSLAEALEELRAFHKSERTAWERSQAQIDAYVAALSKDRDEAEKYALALAETLEATRRAYESERAKWIDKESKLKRRAMEMEDDLTAFKTMTRRGAGGKPR